MDQRIEKATLFIAKNFKDELLLSNLAKESGMSKFHFHRLFKKEIGSTPLQFINKLKIENAAHLLLLYPHKKQLEVAFDSGYSSPVAFARVFKRYYKTTPINYRKKKQREKKIKSIKSVAVAPIKIHYLKQQKIAIKQTHLSNKNLSRLYHNLISKISKPATSVGFFIDAPMHIHLSDCRYFAGLETENQTKNRTYFEIEEGYYTSFTIKGNFSSLKKQIVDYKAQYIDPSPYEIASFIAFEKMKLPINSADFDYFSAKRTLYIKLKHK